MKGSTNSNKTFESQLLKHQGIIADLRQLKSMGSAPEPIFKKQRRQKFIKELYKDMKKTTPIQTQQPKKNNQEGLFSGKSFCIPLLDPRFDPSQQQITKIIKNIYSQNGSVVQYFSEMENQSVNYILADERSDIKYLHDCLSGKIFYISILDIKFVKDCINKFKKLEMAVYNLETNPIYQQKRDKTEEKLKRSKPEIREQEPLMSIFKKKVLNDRSDVRVQPQIRQIQKQDDKKLEKYEKTTQKDEQNKSQTHDFDAQQSDEQTIRVDNSQRQQEDQEQSKKPSVNKNVQLTKIDIQKISKNKIICDQLKKLQQFYKRKGDRRSFAYNRAIAAIRKLKFEIKYGEQLKKIVGIGPKIIQKVTQLLQKGTIHKLQVELSKKQNIVYEQLLRVYGIGPKVAQQLYMKGIKSIKDLERNQQLLNENQKMGLKYIKQFEKKIPRQEITEMLEIIKPVFFKIIGSKKYHTIEVVGSYRRGTKTSGDIDILITRKDGYIQRNLLQTLVTELSKQQFITEHITFPKPYDGKNSVSYMGVCIHKDIHHRIDIKYYSHEQYPFALLYFTGSDLFNRQMRAIATKKGLQLSDHGLKIRQNSKLWNGGKIGTISKEQDIFKILEIQYRPPPYRDL